MLGLSRAPEPASAECRQLIEGSSLPINIATHPGYTCGWHGLCNLDRKTKSLESPVAPWALC